MTNPTIATYNAYAHIYDQEVIEFWNRFPKEFLDRFVRQLPGRRILDVGSGSGRDALLLRDMGCEVVCQDGSKSMVEMTTELGFESHLAEFAQIDFPASSFDGVWAYTSLIHIQKDQAEQVMQDLQQLLKPDGIFAIGVIEGREDGMVERASMPDASRYFKKYTSSELQALVEPQGFTVLYEQKYQPHSSVYINQLYKRI